MLTLTAKTAGKVASRYRDGKTMSDEEYARKVSAGAHIDELAQVSARGNSIIADEDGRHGDSASEGWNHRTAYFLDFDGKYYRCKISISMGADGSIVYNIGDMRERSFPTAQEVHHGSSANSGALGREASSENSIRSSEENVNEKFSREVKDAEEHFGTTYKIKEAGYICTDGKMLDFSGRHEGAPGGYRTVDHRDITDALGEDYGDGDYSGGMVKFMSEGNIRVSPEIGGINLSVAPNKSQRSTLDRYISSFRGEVVLDIDNTNGDTVASVEYPKYTHSSVVLKDIDDYFNKGKVPEPFTSGVKYSKEQTKYDYSKPFAEQIDDWAAGKIPKRDTLIVSGTPKVFADIGMPSLPVTINSSHVDYALNGTKDFDHELGKDLLKQLPEAIKKPVAIMTSKTKSSNSIVAMLEIRHNAKQVVVPVNITGFGYQNGIRIDSNAIASVYGKDYSIAKVLRDAIQEESNGQFRLYYLNEKKATALLQGAKVLMPKMPATRDGGFIHSLTETASPVKLKIKDVTESQQFKRWFAKSKVTNSDGTPKIVYHQTENEFTVFETRREGAGTRDSGTPFGIFLKSSNKDIGLKGKRQMALYARIENPLRAKNRSEFLKAMQSMSDEYAEIINQHEALDREYKEKTQSAIREFKNYIIEWRADNPGADSHALYDDAKFNELFEAEDTLASEWTEKADKLSTKAKEALTKALESNGYDGVILERDDGSFGRSTDAYIALHPEQVKSATDNIGTFDNNNPDIRYSREPETLNELRRQNEQLRERVDYWRRQTKPTKVKQLRMDDIRRLAKEVVEMSETDLKPKDITEGLTELGKYLLNEPELRYTDVSEMAEDIAADVIENATAIANEEDTETHNGLKDHLRRVKLHDDGSAEFESIRSKYKRRIMFDTGRKRYDKKGLGVDIAYMELHDMFGEAYFPEDIIDPADQLERIAEAKGAPISLPTKPLRTEQAR